jgi:GTP-binding protein LepA
MYKALEYDLTIIPVINKVDLPSAEVENAKLEIMEAFGFKEEEIVLASGKTGVGVKEILDAIVERVQPPKIVNTDLTRGLVFDSFYHDFKGVVALVKLVEGEINDREKLYFLGSETEVTPVDIGYLKPAMQAQSKLVQ